jgi:transposase
MVGGRGSESAHVVIGVDTHKDEHVAVAIDQLGARLSEYRVATTTKGYADLERWSCSLGEVRAFGVEGTGAYGAGLARFLTSRGRTVVKVNRPDRSTRRRKGKSDPTDAEMAARAVLANVADSTPKSGVGEVEMIRMLRNTRISALKARTQALNQMQALIVTAPAELQETLLGLTKVKLMSRCARLRPGELTTPTAVAKHTLKSLARRCRQLTIEIDSLRNELSLLTSRAAPALINSFGVGPDSAAALLVTAGSNPERLNSEAAFAALCGVSPIPASSGKTNRHRLNRGGDRRANAALHRIVIVRLCFDDRTKTYMTRRTGEGMTKTEVIRCLKRYVAREVFRILREMRPDVALQTAARHL